MLVSRVVPIFFFLSWTNRPWATFYGGMGYPSCWVTIRGELTAGEWGHLRLRVALSLGTSDVQWMVDVEFAEGGSLSSPKTSGGQAKSLASFPPAYLTSPCLVLSTGIPKSFFPSCSLTSIAKKNGFWGFGEKTFFFRHVSARDSFCHFTLCACSVFQSYLTLWGLLDCTLPGSLSMGFFRQEYWSGSPFPPPGDLPHPGITPPSPASPALAGRFSTPEPPGKP